MIEDITSYKRIFTVRQKGSFKFRRRTQLPLHQNLLSDGSLTFAVVLKLILSTIRKKPFLKQMIESFDKLPGCDQRADRSGLGQRWTNTALSLADL